jgi:hypothetical protein
MLMRMESKTAMETARWMRENESEVCDPVRGADAMAILSAFRLCCWRVHRGRGRTRYEHLPVRLRSRLNPVQFFELASRIDVCCGEEEPALTYERFHDVIEKGSAEEQVAEIQTLNDGPEGWVDLVFADPPFNIGYLYHGYDDEKDVDEYVDWSASVDARGASRAQADGLVLPRDRRRVRGRPVPRRAAQDRLPHAQLDHLALHVRPADQEDVRQEPHAHPVLHEGEARGRTPSTPTPCASPARGRRPTPTPAPTPRASCRTTCGSCARRSAPPHGLLRAASDTWNESRVCGTFKEREGWHGCQMPIGVLNRIIKASSNPATSCSIRSTAAARRWSRRRCSGGSTSASISRRSTSRWRAARAGHLGDVLTCPICRCTQICTSRPRCSWTRHPNAAATRASRSPVAACSNTG